MLVSLSIRNLAVIEHVDLEFGVGLTVLTGETGAGKSILLDALGLATGQRSDVSLVRPGADRAGVAATFEVAPDHPASLLLIDRGVACEGEIIVRRQVGSDGRSKAFINDEPVGVALLGDVGELLVEVHGQHDQRGLLRPEMHRQLLDAFGGHGKAVSAVRQAHTGWAQAREALERMMADEHSLAERRETLARDVEELEKLAPQPGEDDEVSALRSRLANAQKIAEALNTAAEELEGDDGVDAALRRAAGELERIRDVAGGGVDDVLASLDRALVEAVEAVSGIVETGRALEGESGRLEEVEERFFALRDAARRHRVPVDELPVLLDRFSEDLVALNDHEGSLERLEQAEREAADAFGQACTALSKARAKAAAKLDKAVAGELQPLKMVSARFSTSLQPLEAEDRGPNGAEQVVFQVVTNPGAPPGPLSKIASGGELSRFMLALKVAAQKGTVERTLIFDEIDAGIGGAVSDAVGERLRGLGRDGQVLVVTHAPQVAARAERHVRLVKSGDAKAVATSATQLSDDERVEELARMLAGAEVTDAARAAAQSLLKPEAA
ncbi:MAG: DNA repair protein RecN [Rhodospirillaceae bacterium]|nr:DNA repair protein RecN [Rhodospirillaceae bacterium]|tara:strand:- start:9557 stop:11227 length:1671 start_codon:yes stop_codon:yes gene_type:complete